MPYWNPEESLEGYLNLALRLSGSAFGEESAAEPVRDSSQAAASAPKLLKQRYLPTQLTKLPTRRCPPTQLPKRRCPLPQLQTQRCPPTQHPKRRCPPPEVSRQRPLQSPLRSGSRQSPLQSPLRSGSRQSPLQTPLRSGIIFFFFLCIQSAITQYQYDLQ